MKYYFKEFCLENQIGTAKNIKYSFKTAKSIQYLKRKIFRNSSSGYNDEV